MMKLSDMGLSARTHARHYHGNRCAQIRGFHRRAGKLWHAFDSGLTPFDANISTHALEFGHVHKAVLKNVLMHI